MFLDLPTELACEIVGQWLSLKDVVRLDTAFCHVGKRNILHKSIFQSPLCIITNATCALGQNGSVCKWGLARHVRLGSLCLTNLVLCEEYLREFGQVVKSVNCNGLYVDQPHQLSLIAQHCTNLRELEVGDLITNEYWVEILRSCVHLASIKMRFIYYQEKAVLERLITQTHHLKLISIDSVCDDARCEEILFRMCDPRTVKRLRITHLNVPDWKLFVNLRSLCLWDFPDGAELARICTLCPWIVNLDLRGYVFLSDDAVVPAIEAVHELRTLSVEYETRLTDHFVDALVDHHKDTLEAVYMYHSGALPGTSVGAINRMLRECVRLNTISITAQDDIDYSLMGNMSTIALGLNVYAVHQLGQFCPKLQHLHIAGWINQDIADALVTASRDGLKALRVVYYTDDSMDKFSELVDKLRQQLPLVRVVREFHRDWCRLFDMPI